jgi:hypothetical protein
MLLSVAGVPSWTFNNVGTLELKFVVTRVLSGQSSGKSECCLTSFSWLTVELVLLFLIFRVRNRRLPKREPCAHAVALAFSLTRYSWGPSQLCNGVLLIKLGVSKSRPVEGLTG